MIIFQLADGTLIAIQRDYIVLVRDSSLKNGTTTVHLRTGEELQLATPFAEAMHCIYNVDEQLGHPFHTHEQVVEAVRQSQA